MADIVVFWYSADREVAGDLIDRLRDSGLDVWHYGDGMDVGNIIEDQILKEIHQARVAVLCASNAAAESSQWFSTESAWCVSDLKSDRYPLETFAVVQVGNLDHTKLHQTVQGSYVLDLSPAASREKGYLRLIRRLFENLRRRRPLVVTTAVLAMTKRECVEHLDQEKIPSEVVQLCHRAGITNAELRDRLLERYGHTSRDFRPFREMPTCVDLVHASVRRVNAVLAQPRVVVWMDGDFLMPDVDTREDAEDRWSRGDSLLIVDSVSCHHPRIQELLNAIPSPRDSRRGMVLWVPPFTCHSGDQLTLFRDLARLHRYVSSAFRTWKDGEHLSYHGAVAFDITMPAGLCAWLHRSFEQAGEKPRADPAKLRQLRSGSHRTSFEDLNDVRGTEGTW